jgi:hypothetical protein
MHQHDSCFVECHNYKVYLYYLRCFGLIFLYPIASVIYLVCHTMQLPLCINKRILMHKHDSRFVECHGQRICLAPLQYFGLLLSAPLLWMIYLWHIYNTGMQKPLAMCLRMSSKWTRTCWTKVKSAIFIVDYSAFCWYHIALCSDSCLYYKSLWRRRICFVCSTFLGGSCSHLRARRQQRITQHIV